MIDYMYVYFSGEGVFTFPTVLKDVPYLEKFKKKGQSGLSLQ